jgi:predicted nucleic acid-binding protein
MKTSSYLLDTNVILRFLTGEPEAQAQSAKTLIDRCEAGEIQLKVTPLVVAEVVFVLSGQYYAHARGEIADALIPFLESPRLDIEDRDALILGLRHFARHSIDYADAYLAAKGQISGQTIASFDRDFRKIDELDVLDLNGL